MEKTILKQIHDIESRMERGLEKARSDKEKFISSAQAEAARLIESEKETASRALENRIAKKREELMAKFGITTSAAERVF